MVLSVVLSKPKQIKKIKIYKLDINLFNGFYIYSNIRVTFHNFVKNTAILVNFTIIYFIVHKL